MYKKIASIFAIVTMVTIALFINGCNESITPPTNSENQLDAGNGCDTPNVFCGSPGTIRFQNPCPGNVQTIDLWGGVGNPDAGVLVGRLEFTLVAGNTWRVCYVITNPSFTMSQVHFSIKDKLSDIPKSGSGNPIPGQFQYKFNGPFANPFCFNITTPTDAAGDGFYVAAHASGNLGGADCFNVSIPTGCVTVSSLQHGVPEGGYWEFDLSNAGTFNGHYVGWCMDLGTAILDSGFGCAHMFSSLAPFPEYLKASIEGWQDMDKINWLLNNILVGQQIQRMNYLCQPVGGMGTINVFDYQKAIWRILDLGPGSTYAELSDSLVVNAIVCAMNANGEGFVPSCINGDVIAFFVDPGLNPNGTRAQPFLAAAPCCDGQNISVWGDAKYGGNFSGNNWATYFRWQKTCP